MKNSLTIFICPQQSSLPGVQRTKSLEECNILYIYKNTFLKNTLTILHNFKHNTRVRM